MRRCRAQNGRIWSDRAAAIDGGVRLNAVLLTLLKLMGTRAQHDGDLAHMLNQTLN